MAKISKEEFEKLPESIKSLFVADGEDYISQTEADAALKAKNKELLEEVKKKNDFVKQFEGLDAEAARKALAELTKLEEKKLADKGKYDELLEKYKTEFETKLSAAETEKNQLFSNLKRERLTNFLIEKGVLPDRAKYALTELDEQIELASDEKGFSLKLKNGVGDAKEMDGVIEGLKTNSSFLFAPTGASGSGASGSNSFKGQDVSNLSVVEKLNIANSQK
jgi:hypothetical protein